MKWLWRNGQHEAGYWKRIIAAKFGAQNHLVYQGKHLTTWGGSMEAHQQPQPRFFQNIYFNVGNGLHIRLWKDKWLGSTSLKESFPRLYQIACNQDASIAQYKDGNSWNPIFRRNLSDWEINVLLTLFTTLAEYNFDIHQPTESCGEDQKVGSTTSRLAMNICALRMVF